MTKIESPRTKTHAANINTIASFLIELDPIDYEDSRSSLNMSNFGVDLLSEIGDVPIVDRARTILDSETRNSCMAGYAVALLSAPDVIKDILANDTETEQDGAIRDEAQKLMGLTNSEAEHLFHPWKYCNPSLEVQRAVHLEEVWPEKGAAVLGILLSDNRVDWNEAFRDEEMERRHEEEAALKQLPSLALEDYSRLTCWNPSA